MSDDPFGRALRDHHLGERTGPLVQRHGDETLEHPIESSYFGDVDPSSERAEWLDRWLEGPLLDMGAGVGRDARYFQDEFEVVAIEASEPLVATTRERGVTDARHVDMFALRESFPRDRFRSAHAYGTQVGLAGSMAGVRRLLRDVGSVTTPDATAVLDSYDPENPRTADLLGFRPDPAPGLASREFHFEYDGVVDETLHLRLFTPGRLREAAAGTDWEVVDVRRGRGEAAYHYQAALAKP